MHRQLANTTTYKPLQSNPTKKLKTGLIDWVKKGLNKKILDKKEAKYLIPHTPKISVMYIVPKVHKSKDNPPGRPIIRIDSQFSRVGEYLDIYLQPLVMQGNAYLKDSRGIH